MALVNLGPNYTRTGQDRGVAGFFTSLGNKAAMIPFIGAAIAPVLNYIGGGIEGIGWLLRGKPLSAATAVAGGVVSGTVNGFDSAFWFVQAGSGLATGRSAGTHARALTENVIGGVTGVLGIRPTVLSSHMAGVGSTGQSNRPGQWATAEANRRGVNAQALHNAYAQGNQAEMAALQSANGQYRG